MLVVLNLAILVLMVVIVLLMIPVLVIVLLTVAVLMVMVIFMVAVLMVVIVVMLVLHALHNLLFLDLVAENLEKVDDNHILVGCLRQRIPDPAVRLASHIDKEVAGGDFHNIIHCGLITVKVDAVVKKHDNIRPRGIFPEDI